MGDIPMERKDLIIKIVEDCINELHGSHNTRNLTALAKKHHKEDDRKRPVKISGIFPEQKCIPEI